MNKNRFFALAVLAIVFIAGCATGNKRDYQADIDKLNTKVDTLQDQSTAKDDEIARLKLEQARIEREAAEAEADRRALEEKLAAQRKAASLRPNTSAAPVSDLK